MLFRGRSVCFGKASAWVKFDMRKRIKLHDFTVRATDTYHNHPSRGVHRHLRSRLASPKSLLGLGLLVIFAFPLVAQTNAPAPDGDSAFAEILQRQYLFGDWSGKRTALEEKGI